MLTNYHIWQIKKAIRFMIPVLIAIFVIGNIIAFFIKDPIKLPDNVLYKKNGFLLFKDANAYISLIEKYPYNPGVELTIYTIREGESYWDVIQRYRISIDTFIGANPQLDSLLAKAGTKVVVPHKDGLLITCKHFYDAWLAKLHTTGKGSISGRYIHHPLELLAMDDIRFAFIENARPIAVNSKIEKLYTLRQKFQSPINGRFTSMYGDRVDPLEHGMAFHNGLDICAPQGTPIKPVQNGYVNFTGWLDGYGFTIIIQHDEGYESWYGHCQKIFAQTGEFVTTDTIIGTVGSTGRSTGPHLHFMLLQHGKMLNPIMFIW